MKRIALILALAACAHSPAAVRTSAAPEAAPERQILLASADVGSSVRQWYSSKLLQQPWDPWAPTFNTITVTGSGNSAFTGSVTAKSFSALNGGLSARNANFQFSIGSAGTAFLYNASAGSQTFGWDFSTIGFHSSAITGDASTTITLGREDAIAQKIGTGSGSISLMGMLAARTTPASNVSTGETDLQVVNLGASSLTTTGHCVSLKARGVTANNANTKTVKVYFGTTAIITASMTVSIAGAFTADYFVCRTGASTQRYDARLEEINTGTNAVTKVFVAQGTLAETETNALPMKLTGTSGTASSDITENQSATYFQ